mmetsp:Transcript_10448/g.28561  ORF Transcript_10448/g.28561 Transcript_10448/m.28561 type:complete len:201 (-) Transcript_10448:1054-1656(-)
MRRRGARGLILPLLLCHRCLCDLALLLLTFQGFMRSALCILCVLLHPLCLFLQLHALLFLGALLPFALCLLSALDVLQLLQRQLLCYELVLPLQSLCLSVGHLQALREHLADDKHLHSLAPQLRQPLLIALDRVAAVVVILARTQGQAIIGLHHLAFILGYGDEVLGGTVSNLHDVAVQHEHIALCAHQHHGGLLLCCTL